MESENYLIGDSNLVLHDDTLLSSMNLKIHAAGGAVMNHGIQEAQKIISGGHGGAVVVIHTLLNSVRYLFKIGLHKFCSSH